MLSDVEFAKAEYQKVIKEAADYAQQDTETKKSFVLRLKEKAVIVFDVEKRNISDLSSFIWNELSKYDFTYPRSHFYELFSDPEKGNYSQSSVGNIHEHEFINGKCECGNIERGGVVYRPIPIVEKDESFTEDDKEYQKHVKKAKENPLQNPVTEYIQRIGFNCENLRDFCRDLLNKYYSNEEIAKIIEAQLPNIEKLLEEQKYVEAKIIHLNKLTDFRNKIGEFEKLKFILLEKTVNLARVAKTLRITPKHGSKNIIRNFDAYMKNLRWFRSINLVCKRDYTKGDMIQINIADWYEQQLQHKALGLEQIDLNAT